MEQYLIKLLFQTTYHSRRMTIRRLFPTIRFLKDFRRFVYRRTRISRRRQLWDRIQGKGQTWDWF